MTLETTWAVASILKGLLILGVVAAFAITLAAVVSPAGGRPPDRGDPRGRLSQRYVAVASSVIAGAVAATGVGSFVGAEIAGTRVQALAAQLIAVAAVSAAAGLLAGWLAGHSTVARAIVWPLLIAGAPAAWFLFQYLRP